MGDPGFSCLLSSVVDGGEWSICQCPGDGGGRGRGIVRSGNFSCASETWKLERDRLKRYVAYVIFRR